MMNCTCNCNLDFIIGETLELDFDIGEVTVIDADPYEGEYIVTPLAFEEVILPTKRKVMQRDVTVLEVPYTETSNVHGTTVIIATN